jgi:hypothetical protein
MNRKIRVLVGGIAAVLVSAQVCFATVINVPGEQPTIQAGIDAAQENDTVLVAPGVYTENIDFSGKRIVLISESGADNTTITAATVGLPTVSLINAEPKGAELSGFTVTGSNNSGIRCSGSSPTILNNIVTGNSSSHTNDSPGIDLKGTTGSLIKGNEIYTNYADTYGASIHANGCVGDTICYNLLHHNIGYTDIRCMDTEALIHNNTLAVTTWSGISLEGGHLEIRNNIIFFAKNYAVQIVSGTCDADYNCTYANVENYLNGNPGAGSLYEGAHFADSAAGDYMLLTSSPCIDAGDPDPYYNDPDGTRNDIGAIFAGIDTDGDEVPDNIDNCRFIPNPDQRDNDGDGIGNVCDDCDCNGHCDLDRNGGLNPLDIAIIVKYVYLQLDARQPMETTCVAELGDWDLIEGVNPVDVVWYVYYVYRQYGDGPQNPCEE